MSEEVRRIVAEFVARDLTGGAFTGVERKLSSFQKTANSIAKIGRATSFVYLVSQLDDVAASLQKASYNGENFGLALLKSLPVAKQIDEVTSNIAKSLADMATRGQITSNEKMTEAQSGYKKLFEEMTRAAELSKATAEDAAKIRVEHIYKDRIKEIEEWSKGTQDLTKHNELLKKQIQELEELKAKPMGKTVNVGSIFTGITPVTTGRTKTDAQINKEIAALESQILAYDTTTQKANLLAAAEAERAAALTKANEKTVAAIEKEADKYEDYAADRAEITARMYDDMGIHDKRYKDAQIALLDIQKQDYAKFISDKALLDDWYAARKKKLDETAVDQWANQFMGDNLFDRLSENYASGLDDMGSKLTEWMKTGKMDWESWTDSLLTSWMDTLNKMAVAQLQQAIISPLIGSLVGGVMGAFGGGSNIGADVPVGMGGTVARMHGGGIVGRDYSSKTTVPMSLFANAPRLHGGLRNDEFPAILQKGEQVIPKGRGGDSFSPNIKVVIVRNEQEAFEEYLNSARGEKVLLKKQAKNNKYF